MFLRVSSGTALLWQGSSLRSPALLARVATSWESSSLKVELWYFPGKCLGAFYSNSSLEVIVEAGAGCPLAAAEII